LAAARVVEPTAPPDGDIRAPSGGSRRQAPSPTRFAWKTGAQMPDGALFHALARHFSIRW